MEADAQMLLRHLGDKPFSDMLTQITFFALKERKSKFGVHCRGRKKL